MAALCDATEKGALRITSDTQSVLAFCTIWDAIRSALFDEPIDEHACQEGVLAGLSAHAAPLRDKKRGGVRMATREIRQELNLISITSTPEERILFEPRPDILNAASDFVSRKWLRVAQPAARPREASAVPEFVNGFPVLSPADDGVILARDLIISLSGRPRGEAAPRITVYDVKLSALTNLPAGMRVLLACFSHSGALDVSGKVLRLRIACANEPAVALLSDRALIYEGNDAVALSRKGSYARVHVFQNKIDAVLLFLPPRVHI